MKQVDITICRADDGTYSAYCNEHPALFGMGGLSGTGKVGKISGIHAKQIWSYMHGLTKPRKAQITKIENAVQVPSTAF